MVTGGEEGARHGRESDGHQPLACICYQREGEHARTFGFYVIELVYSTTCAAKTGYTMKTSTTS